MVQQVSLTVELAMIAARAASTKTTDETIVLDVGQLLGITDYFVITSGRNDRQVRSIVDEVHRQMREAGSTVTRQVEGLSAGQWVLVDYGDFVLHVFDAESREFYGLERLWADAVRVPVEGLELPTTV